MSNKITSLVTSYLDYKRGLGFQMTAEAVYLNAFARYTQDIGYTGALTRKIVFQWCESGDDPSLVTKGRRFESLKGLANYADAFDADSELLPKLPYGNPHKRVRPHIYTLDETCRLMEQCDHLQMLILQTNCLTFAAVSSIRTESCRYCQRWQIN